MKVKVRRANCKYVTCNSCFAADESLKASSLSEEIKIKQRDKFFEIEVNSTVVTVCDDCLKEIIKQAVEVI